MFLLHLSLQTREGGGRKGVREREREGGEGQVCDRLTISVNLNCHCSLYSDSGSCPTLVGCTDEVWLVRCPECCPRPTKVAFWITKVSISGSLLATEVMAPLYWYTRPHVLLLSQTDISDFWARRILDGFGLANPSSLFHWHSRVDVGWVHTHPPKQENVFPGPG